MHRHVLRLLLHLHHKVAPAKLESLQKALEPTKQVGREAGEGEFRLQVEAAALLDTVQWNTSSASQGYQAVA